MVVSKHIFWGLDFAVAAATIGLPNNVDATAQGKGEFITVHCTCTGGKPLAPHFPKGNPSATHMLNPSFTILSITLELRTQFSPPL